MTMSRTMEERQAERQYHSIMRPGRGRLGLVTSNNLLATTCASYSSRQIVTGVLLLFRAACRHCLNIHNNVLVVACVNNQTPGYFCSSKIKTLITVQMGHNIRIECSLLGIRPVKNWMLVCWWWWFDWSIHCTTYSTTTSIILCFNKHRLTQVHLENGR